MLPLLIGAASLIGGALLAKAGLNDLETAKEIVEQAKSKFDKYNNLLKSEIDQANKTVYSLTQLKLSEYKYIKEKCLPIFNKFKNIILKEEEIIFYEISKRIENLNFNKKYLELTDDDLISIGLNSISVGIGSSLLAGFSFSSFFAPAILASGIMIALKGDNALTEATEYKAQIDKKCEELDFNLHMVKLINKRCEEVIYVITKLHDYLSKQIKRLKRREIMIRFKNLFKNPIKNYKVMLKSYKYQKTDLTQKELMSVYYVIESVKYMKEILTVPIIDEIKRVTNESDEKIKQIRNYLKLEAL